MLCQTCHMHISQVTWGFTILQIHKKILRGAYTKQAPPQLYIKFHIWLTQTYNALEIKQSLNKA